MSIYKKFLLSFLASLVLVFSIAPNFLVAKAQSVPPATTGAWFDQEFLGWYQKVYDPTNASEIFGERYTAAQVQWVFYGVLSYIFNLFHLRDVIVCLMPNTGDISACSDAVSGTIGSHDTGRTDSRSGAMIQNQSLLSLIFADRPISGIGYVKEKINNFRLIPEAKAQTIGFGFSALSPIQAMWRGTRNVAFGLFVLVSIIFAFMIMFRVKINPQTVVTVQSAIPKVITALILVTFSYAIAGFLIDLMYVVIGILSVVLTTFSPIFNTGTATLQTIGTFNFLIYGQPFGGLQIGVLGFIGILVLPMLMSLTILIILSAVASPLVSPVPALIFVILLVIVVIVVIWNTFKTIWALFKAFANIVLLTIFAPLQIALGVLIPNFGFGQWVKSYIAQLSTFVVTGVIGYLSLIFMVQGIYVGLQNVTGGTTITGTILKAIGSAVNAPILGAIPTSPWPPLLGSGDGVWIGLMFLGVSFVLFTMIPKATELVASFLSGKPFAYGSAVGEAFGPIKTGVGIGTSYGANYLGELGESQLKSDDPETRALGRRNLQKGSALKTLQGLIR